MIKLDDIQKYFDNQLNENMVISHNTKIGDLGLDSLELAELILYIEKIYFIEIKFSEINGQLSVL